MIVMFKQYELTARKTLGRVNYEMVIDGVAYVDIVRWSLEKFIANKGCMAGHIFVDETNDANNRIAEVKILKRDKTDDRIVIDERSEIFLCNDEGKTIKRIVA